MNLYRYRVVERTTTTIIGGKSTKETTYYIQESLLGIMWVDKITGNGYVWSYRTEYEAIYAYDRLTKKETIEEKVVHPINTNKKRRLLCLVDIFPTSNTK